MSDSHAAPEAKEEVDVEASDPGVSPAVGAAAAANLHADAALRRQARAALAASTGCSRAVPQHAVALMAGLRGTEAASPSGAGEAGLGSPGLSGGTRPHVVAACWRYHAEQRGCARAVCRADVISLVGLLKPANWGAQHPQVSP